MARATRTPATPTSSDIVQLTEAVSDLAVEVRQLGATLAEIRREVIDGLNHRIDQLSAVLDDVRDDLIHAVRNGRFNGCKAEEEWRVVPTDGSTHESCEEAAEAAQPAHEPLAPSTTCAQSLFD